MAYTFLKAQGLKVGKSLCEDEQLGYAKEMLEAAKAKGINFLLPVDNVIADKFPTEKDASDIQMKVCEGDIPDGWMGLDIGPKTVELFSEAIKTAKTVVWNGPMGCFEFAPLAKGTFGVCDAVATASREGHVRRVRRGGDGQGQRRHFDHRRRRFRQRGEEERQGGRDDAHLHRRRRVPRVPRGQDAPRRRGAQRQVGRPPRWRLPGASLNKGSRAYAREPLR